MVCFVVSVKGFTVIGGCPRYVDVEHVLWHMILGVDYRSCIHSSLCLLQLFGHDAGILDGQSSVSVASISVCFLGLLSIWDLETLYVCVLGGNFLL